MFLRSMFDKCRLDIAMKIGRPFEAIIGDDVYFVNTANEWQKVNTRTREILLFNYDTKQFEKIRHDEYHVTTWNYYAESRLCDGYQYFITDIDTITEQFFEANSREEFEDKTSRMSYEDYEYLARGEHGYDHGALKNADLMVETMTEEEREAFVGPFAKDAYEKIKRITKDKLLEAGTPSDETIKWVMSGKAYRAYLHAISLLKVWDCYTTEYGKLLSDLVRRMATTVGAISKLFGLKIAPIMLHDGKTMITRSDMYCL